MLVSTATYEHHHTYGCLGRHMGSNWHALGLESMYSVLPTDVILVGESRIWGGEVFTLIFRKSI